MELNWDIQKRFGIKTIYSIILRRRNEKENKMEKKWNGDKWMKKKAKITEEKEERLKEKK